MPNALETLWVTLEVNDVPLSLCNKLGRPNLGMISWSSFFTPHNLSKTDPRAGQGVMTSWDPPDWSLGIPKISSVTNAG